MVTGLNSTVQPPHPHSCAFLLHYIGRIPSALNDAYDTAVHMIDNPPRHLAQLDPPPKFSPHMSRSIHITVTKHHGNTGCNPLPTHYFYLLCIPWPLVSRIPANAACMDKYCNTVFDIYEFLGGEDQHNIESC